MNSFIQDENMQRKKVRRIFIEKRKAYDAEAHRMYRDSRVFFVRNKVWVVAYRYDITGITDKEYIDSKRIIFQNLDVVYEETLPVGENERAFAGNIFHSSIKIDSVAMFAVTNLR